MTCLLSDRQTVAVAAPFKSADFRWDSRYDVEEIYVVITLVKAFH